MTSQGSRGGSIQYNLDQPRKGLPKIVEYKRVPCHRDNNRGYTPKAYYLTKLFIRRQLGLDDYTAKSMQMIDGKVLKHDLSFKVAAKIDVDGESPFMCTLTVMNEYNQVTLGILIYQEVNDTAAHLPFLLTYRPFCHSLLLPTGCKSTLTYGKECG